MKYFYDRNQHDDLEIIDTVLQVIEEDAGVPVQRIAKYEKMNDIINIIIVFTDYTVLEGQVIILDYMDLAETLKIEGYYY